MNNWIPLLESARELKHKSVPVPDVDTVLANEYARQLLSLGNLLDLQNKDLDHILREHTEEAHEVVSVAMGKLKKRIRTAKEIEDGGEDSEEETTEKSKNSGWISPRKRNEKK